MMKETTSEQENELKPDSVEQKSTTSANGTTADDQNADEQFDVVALEEAFGLPAGSLKDVKDADSAFDAVRTMTDKILSAGVGFTAPPTTFEKPAEKPAEKTATKTTTASSGNAEIDALRAELTEVKSLFAQQAELTQAQIQANNKIELERRIASKMDSWASPKYGVKGSRNYKQTRASQEFVDVLLPNFLAGRQAAGLSIDGKSLEIYMEQLRVHDDENYTPPKRDGKKADALGTPGVTKGSDQKTAPGNIHQALMKNAS